MHDPFRYIDIRGIDKLIHLLFKELDGELFYYGFCYSFHFLQRLSFHIQHGLHRAISFCQLFTK